MKFLLVLFLVLPFQVRASAIAFDVDSVGNVVAAWEAIDPTTKNIVIKAGYFLAGGLIPTMVTTLSANGYNSNAPRVSASGTGRGIVMWTSDDPAIGFRSLKYAYFSALLGWQATTNLTNSSEEVIEIDKLLLTPAGTAIVMWDSVSQSGGGLMKRFCFGSYATFAFGVLSTLP